MDSSSGVIFSACQSKFFLSSLSRQQFLRDKYGSFGQTNERAWLYWVTVWYFSAKNRFLKWFRLCYKFLWTTVCSYMSVLINTNHIIQHLIVMPLTVDQYSADTWHLLYWPGVDQYTKISTHTPSTYIINQHLVRHVVKCGSTCWSITCLSYQVIVNRHVDSVNHYSAEGCPNGMGILQKVERWMQNAEWLWSFVIRVRKWSESSLRSVCPV